MDTPYKRHDIPAFQYSRFSNSVEECLVKGSTSDSKYWGIRLTKRAVYVFRNTEALPCNLLSSGKAKN